VAKGGIETKVASKVAKGGPTDLLFWCHRAGGQRDEGTVLRRQVSVMRFFFFSSLLMQKHTAKQVNAAMNWFLFMFFDATASGNAMKARLSGDRLSVPETDV
jgi:hypothetical protein